MRISLNSAVPLDYRVCGYGNVTEAIYSSLKQAGWQVSIDDPTAPVQFHYKQPHLLRPVPGAYNILLFVWESTELRSGWDKMLSNPHLDEIWTASDWNHKIFQDLGINVTKIFPHGIDPIWKPKKRKSRANRPVKYLIVDAEANRKGCQEAFDGFRAVFGDDPRKATLTIKSRQRCMIRWFDERRMIHSPDEFRNVKIELGTYSDEEMVKLIQDHDVNIFPSLGEGFGLIPFQMLATGGISIVTEEWCHYTDYLNGLGIRSSYVQSPWRGEHEGNMCKPNQKHLEDLIRKSYDEFDELSKMAFKRSLDLHVEYNWLDLTKQAFKDVERNANLKFERLQG